MLFLGCSAHPVYQTGRALSIIQTGHRTHPPQNPARHPEAGVGLSHRMTMMRLADGDQLETGRGPLAPSRLRLRGGPICFFAWITVLPPDMGWSVP
jgi:hypothetical protein